MDAQQVRATREVVVERMHAVGAAVAGQGLTPYDASGAWTSCTDDAVGRQYVAQGRLDTAGGSSADALDRVVQALVAELDWQPGDVEDLGDRRRAGGPLGDVDLTLNAYAERPELLVSVLGPCLPVDDADRADFEGGSEPIEIGQARG